MRTIDTEKRDRVVQTVLQITMEEGLAALSFDKLAKLAGISTGTPYVYYKDKTDMLSCIYAQVWLGLQEGLQQAIDMGRTPGEKLFFGLRQLAQTFLAHPQEAHFFLSVLNAPEFVTPEVLRENCLPSPSLMAVMGFPAVQHWPAKASRSSVCGRSAARATSAKRRPGRVPASTLLCAWA